jgi:hypothetical protein
MSRRKIALSLIDEMKAKYPRRPAMKEELEKIREKLPKPPFGFTNQLCERFKSSRLG